MQKRDGLDPGDLKALAAADVFAGYLVVAAHHVGLGLGEARAVALVGVARQGILLATDEPVQLILGGLAAVGASERMIALFWSFIKKITLFHCFTPWCFLFNHSIEVSR